MGEGMGYYYFRKDGKDFSEKDTLNREQTRVKGRGEHRGQRKSNYTELEATV